jgi:Xaa-Pro aminopeptidase
MEIKQRLAALRAAMSESDLYAVIIPSNDPHFSEYVATHWQGRVWISGFTGSAGTVIVTQDEAGLWTDSRYFIQAEEQLKGTGIKMHKQKVPYAPEHLQWLRDQLPDSAQVGLDGRLFTPGQLNLIEKQLAGTRVELVTELDPLEAVWKDRPPLPKDRVFALEVKYAGLSREEKLARVRVAMREPAVSALLLTQLDDIAWVLNLRGRDVDFNPVFYAYLLIEKAGAILFIDPEKVDEAVGEALKKAEVSVQPYDQLESFLHEADRTYRIWLDRGTTNARLVSKLDKDQIYWAKGPVQHMKGLKNEVEVENIRAAMQKDGVALLRFYRWLEAEVKQRGVPEAEAAERLANFRSQQGDYFGESFSAIVGYEANGAIVHYRPEHGTCADIRNEGMLLLDSGGQYLQGTTDITRTTVFSEPSSEQKKAYTAVLRGHIALARAVFPKGTTGVQLDTLARMHLWQEQLNYGHGTGHGVGCFLNVHEGPQGIMPSPTNAKGSTPFEPGMFTSNEPGFYKENGYGIRIENLVLCVPAGTSESGEFYRFETLTLFPIDLRPVLLEELTQEEKEWLNAYHQQVYDALAPSLEPEEEEWLRERCLQLIS